MLKGADAFGGKIGAECEELVMYSNDWYSD